MNIGQFFLHSELGHFILYFAGISFIGGMPAPTATSGVAYKWAFASLNSFAGNLARAFSTKIEKSPNWEPAVQQHINNQATPPNPPAQ